MVISQVLDQLGRLLQVLECNALLLEREVGAGGVEVGRGQLSPGVLLTQVRHRPLEVLDGLLEFALLALDQALRDEADALLQVALGLLCFGAGPTGPGLGLDEVPHQAMGIGDRVHDVHADVSVADGPGIVQHLVVGVEGGLVLADFTLDVGEADREIDFLVQVADQAHAFQALRVDLLSSLKVALQVVDHPKVDQRLHEHVVVA